MTGVRKTVAVVCGLILLAVLFGVGYRAGQSDALRPYQSTYPNHERLVSDVIQLLETGDYLPSFGATMGEEDSPLVSALLDARESFQ
jgi:hypothetical protein